ncbi:unnamed protein product [Rotaria sp. Silwood1]|nr:unnamed protein product [Rotaria sp. Silwood1]
MDHSIITRLEVLPVEIFIEIFDYFTAIEIYLAFAHLNNRLNSIVKSLPNLIFVTKNHLDPILSFFYSFKAIHVEIHQPKLRSLSKSNIIRNGNSLFQTYSSLDNGLFHHPLDEIENIIRPDICSQLQSLILPSSSPKLVQSIFNGEFPRLEICYLGKCKPVVLPLSTTTIQLQNLHHLTIRRQDGSAFEKILSVCPSLIYFNFSCNNAIPPFVFTTCCFSSMKYLRLCHLRGFLFHNGQFDLLLSFFPNLRQFHLCVNQCKQHKETIEFEMIANILLHRLPFLKIFDLRIGLIDYMCFSYLVQQFLNAQMHPLFKYILQYDSFFTITSHVFVPNCAYSYEYARCSSE